MSRLERDRAAALEASKASQAKAKRENAASLICPECGGKGPHWVSAPMFLSLESDGFWTCPKFYGADGKRINQ